MPALSRIHLTLVQKVSIIEKSGLPAFDRKKIAEKHGASKITKRLFWTTFIVQEF